MKLLPDLLTTEDVADYLMVSPVTVRRFVKRGELAAYKIGKEYRFQESDVQAFIQNRYVPASNQPSKIVEHILESPKRIIGKKLAQRVQSLLREAAQIAESDQRTFIGWNDIWQGLVTDSGSIAATIIQELKLEYDPSHEPELDNLNRTNLLRELLAQSAQESFPNVKYQDYVGTEHILMAMSRLPMINGKLEVLQRTILDRLEVEDA